MIARKIFLFLIVIVFFASCSNTGNGELIGVQERPTFYQPDPYGMTYIPMGSFTMGIGDQDITHAMFHQPKTVTVNAFFMDETEITNNEYRQFVHWVRDRLARQMLGEVFPEDYLIEEDPKTGEIYDPPLINWKTKIRWTGEEESEALEELYYPERERYFGKKEIDPRKLDYEYYWIDYREMAKKDRKERGDYRHGSLSARDQLREDRSVFVKKEGLNIYPDVYSWISDFSYSYNEPMTQMYFQHPSYDNYPVVGVNWKQAKAFCVWRTQLFDTFLEDRKKESAMTVDFRLPTEAEWEWAARGGYEGNPYPWGGPYTRNADGCVLANFKPLRGDYAEDGGAYTTEVGSYVANDFGLWDMSGNVSEWTNDAFDASSYNFSWDFNPSYDFNSKEDDPIALKRKVIRGGSWKDIAYYLQVSTRSYEYEDTGKCYVGFRCVQNFYGRQKGDKPSHLK